MTTDAEKKENVPKLRFPEFVGEWKSKTLGQVSGRASYGMNAAATEFDGKHKYIRITDISENERAFVPSPLTSPEPPISHEYRLKEGDIVFARTGASTGKSYLYVQDDGELYFAGFLIRFPIIEADAKFVFAQTLRSDFLKWISVVSMRSGQPGINAQEYASYCFNLPLLPEQKKIAAFLGAVDDKIAFLQKKKSLLEEYKSGCMQKLFSRELRFKDEHGNAFPDWKEKKLRDVAKIYDGTHQTPEYVENGVPFFSVEQITSNNFARTKFIAEEVYADECRRVKIERNDILLTRIGDIGTAKLVDWDVRASFYVSLALVKIDRLMLPSFAAQLFMAEFFQRELWHRTIHVAFPKKINLGEIGNCRILVPALPEQRKIADFLSDQDAKIQLVTTEIAQAQAFKKGLLQQMFV